MRNLTKLMIAGAAAAVLVSPASAWVGGWTDSINNVQRNFLGVFAKTDLLADWVGGDMDVSSVAVGNNFTADVEGQGWINTEQTMLGDVKAVLNADIGTLGGDATFSATAICNNSSTTTAGTHNQEHVNIQRCQTLDPAAFANVTVGNSIGDISVSAAAVGNNMSVDSITGRLDARNVQTNGSVVNANTFVDVGNIDGALNAASTAIGNNASYTSRFNVPTP